MKVNYRSIKQSIPLLLVAMSVIFGGCKDGAVGPKGETGESGVAGPAGAKGQTGSVYYKSGFISGNLTGTGSDGITKINENFKFEFTGSDKPILYFESLDRYDFGFNRLDTLGTSYIGFSFNTSKDFSSVQFTNGTLDFVKKVSNNALKTLYGDFSFTRSSAAPKSTITNLKYDANTGVLTGDYTFSVDNQYVSDANNQYSSYSSTRQPFTVTGTFNVVCRKASY